MAKVVRFRVKDGVAIVTIDNPTVNALSAEVRLGLADVFERLERRNAVKAVVLTGEGDVFSAGADVRETGAALAEPSFAKICKLIEDCTLPVVAALHGRALGAGFEIALAAHYRVAEPACLLGLPEVTLGMLPSAGATQRLPRLVGAGVALGMLISGRPIKAREGHARGMIDALAEGHVLTQAFQFAQALLEAGKGPRPVSKMRRGFGNFAGYQADISKRRAAIKGSKTLAMHKIVDCIEAASLLPFDVGCAFEAAAFDDCQASAQSSALRHMFLAERTAGRSPKPLGKVEALDRVGVYGGPGSGSSWALSLMAAATDVTVVCEDVETLDATRDAINQSLDADVSRGALTDAVRVSQQQRLVLTTDFNALVGVGLGIYAGQDTGKGAKDGLRKMAAQMAPDSVLALAGYRNVVGNIGAEIDRSSDVIGLGFATGARRSRLVEVRCSPKTGPQARATAEYLAQKMRKRVMWIGPEAWGVGPRTMATLRKAAQHLAGLGVSISQLANAIDSIDWDTRPFLDRIDGPDQPTSEFNDAQIVNLVLGALSNEGLEMLDGRQIVSTSMVDLALVSSYYFPRWHGGPMRLAQSNGLLKIRNEMNALSDINDFFKPHPLWAEAIKTPQGFDVL